MIKHTVKIEGMMCGMCEAHINDTIRKVFPDAKKVSASRKNGEAVFLTDNAVDYETLQEDVESIGYKLVSCSAAQYKKRGLLGK